MVHLRRVVRMLGYLSIGWLCRDEMILETGRRDGAKEDNKYMWYVSLPLLLSGGPLSKKDPSAFWVRSGCNMGETAQAYC